MFYGKSQRAYLSVMKDGYTGEALAHVLCNNLKVNFVLETVDLLVENHGDSIEANKCLIHSDQGVHYTSQVFRKKVKEEAFVQSMSRKANCWDNAPQESFFGHMKDEIGSERYETFEELKAAIDAYMDYYNNDRYQEGLAKLAPSQYFHFYKTGQYPLAHLIETPGIKNVAYWK